MPVKNFWTFSPYRKRSSAGFTLIELMITVSIIGLLATIAIPRYLVSQRKSRQSEGKLHVAGVYTASRSFHSEYNSYIPSLDAVGYDVEGRSRHYNVGFCSIVTLTPWTGTVSGYSGGQARPVVQRSADMLATYPSDAGWPPGANCPAFNGDCDTLWPMTNPQTLLVASKGILCSNCYTDVWVINELKSVQNCSVGTYGP